MERSELQTNIQVVVLGDAQVGKSTLIWHFYSGQYTATPQPIDMLSKQLSLDGRQVKLTLWDMAATDEHTIPSSYLRRADAVIVVCQRGDIKSQLRVKIWKRLVDEICQRNEKEVPSLLVLNKTDLPCPSQEQPIESLCIRY